MDTPMDLAPPLSINPPPAPGAVEDSKPPAPARASQKLTDFLNIPTLQEIQDGFSAITGLAAVIVDADNAPVTHHSDDARLNERRDALRHTISHDLESPLNQRFEVPIVVDSARLGAFVLTGDKLSRSAQHSREQAQQLADRFTIPPDKRHDFINAVENIGRASHAEALRFAYLLSDAIAEVCRQDIELRNRVDEISALYRVATLLAGQRDLKQVLDTVVQSVTQVMDAKAASIRLLDSDGKELIPKAVYNLSHEYMNKGPILLAKSAIDQQALSGQLAYVADMATDPRIVYPEDARREGLGSILCAGMIYRGRKVGVIRVYTDSASHPRVFSQFEQHLLSAVGQLAAAAIDNARLEDERREGRAIQRQVKLAADVQRRMLPRTNPRFGPFDVAGRYEPSFELGGDFYDFIRFQHTLGITVGDVVGKGVAASLLMASVRGALRAHAEDTYDLDQIMSKVNAALTRDTLDEEFATVFYGTLDATTMRLTYSSAGHDPAYLLRDGKFTELSEGGTVLGISNESRFNKGLVDLKPGDLLLIYTDGVPDAMNFNNERFGRQRIKEAMLASAAGSASDVVNHVLWEVRRFTGLNQPYDDKTLVAVKVTKDRL